MTSFEGLHTCLGIHSTMASNDGQTQEDNTKTLVSPDSIHPRSRDPVWRDIFSTYAEEERDKV